MPNSALEDEHEGRRDADGPCHELPGLEEGDQRLEAHRRRAPRRESPDDRPEEEVMVVVLSSWVVALVILAGLPGFTTHQARNEWPTVGNQVSLPIGPHTFGDAQNHFYNARYEAAAALTLSLRGSQPQDLANDELRTSALLFQLKGLLEQPDDKHSNRKEADKKEALRLCAPCPALIAAFMTDVDHGKALARSRLAANPDDDEALFFLGKLDLNYVWLQLGPLGRKTGWDEYWEARRSLDVVVKRQPQHVRALVARAWIDYIVDTRMPWGTRWVLGGGSRKRALATVRAAVNIPSDFFTHAEATFALWDMQVRERDLRGAAQAGRELADDFPDNREVAAFLESREVRAAR